MLPVGSESTYGVPVGISKFGQGQVSMKGPAGLRAGDPPSLPMLGGCIVVGN